MKSAFVFIVLLFFASSLPASIVASGSCPDEFIGKVAAIIGPEVDSALATNKVVFTNIKNIKGDLGDTVFVDVLRNGTVKTKVGDEFHVSLRKGALCQIEEVNQH